MKSSVIFVSQKVKNDDGLCLLLYSQSHWSCWWWRFAIYRLDSANNRRTNNKVTWEMKSNSLRCCFIFRKIKTKHVYVRVFFPAHIFVSLHADTKSKTMKAVADDWESADTRWRYTDIDLCLFVLVEMVNDDPFFVCFQRWTLKGWICISNLGLVEFLSFLLS